jgi:methionyl-tRNA synthetase
MPGTAEQIWQTLSLAGSVHHSKWQEGTAHLESGHKIGKAKPLFNKIDADEKKLEELLAQVRKRIAKSNCACALAKR